jgi:hypothetical protein
LNRDNGGMGARVVAVIVQREWRPARAIVRDRLDSSETVGQVDSDGMSVAWTELEALAPDPPPGTRIRIPVILYSSANQRC